MGAYSKGQSGGKGSRKIHDTKGRNNHGRSTSYGSSPGYKTVRSGPIWNPTVRTVKTGTSKGPFNGKKKKGW